MRATGEGASTSMASSANMPGVMPKDVERSMRTGAPSFPSSFSVPFRGRRSRSADDDDDEDEDAAAPPPPPPPDDVLRAMREAVLGVALLPAPELPSAAARDGESAAVRGETSTPLALASASPCNP
jgi:hypothetical protein